MPDQVAKWKFDQAPVVNCLISKALQETHPVIMEVESMLKADLLLNYKAT